MHRSPFLPHRCAQERDGLQLLGLEPGVPGSPRFNKIKLRECSTCSFCIEGSALGIDIEQPLAVSAGTANPQPEARV